MECIRGQVGASRIALASDLLDIGPEWRYFEIQMESAIRILVGSSVLMFAVTSCGGKIGEKIRPQEHSAVDAVGTGGGGSCTGAATYARPLIVDLDPDARADLEASMKNGVVVVRYDCTSLRVLANCRVADSGYEYAGVSRKEQVVQINSADDLHANLPLGQAKLSGELKSGRSIDLALVLVGRHSTTVAKLRREQLSDGCEEATHFVQSASLGAFSMVTGSVGKVAVVAEMFNYGGGAKSESERKAMNMDGSLEACRGSSPDAASPPSECRAPLRVELVPLLDSTPVVAQKDKAAKGERAGKKAAVAQENPCPSGYKFADGLCSKAKAQAYLCDPKNEVECKEQCERGSPDSCYNYGALLDRTKHRAQSSAYYKQACDGEIADGCTWYAWSLISYEDGADYVKEATAALKVFNQACTMGSASGCVGAADLLTDHELKIVDKTLAAHSYERACALGDGNGCFQLAEMHFSGDGVAQDSARALDLLGRACKGGDGSVCWELARVLAGGKHGVTKDLPAALVADRAACLSEAWFCGDAARTALTNGKEEESFKFATRGCDANDDEACTRLGDLYRDGRGVARDEAKARALWAKACQNGENWEDACKRIGVKMKE